MTTKRFFTVMASILLLSATVSAAQRPRPAAAAPQQHGVMAPHKDYCRPAAQPRNDMSRRVAIALDYLARHATIDARQYARLTGLGIRQAESELRSMARDARIPIVTACRQHGLYCLAFR
ncbi:MAG: hypothetical protein K2H74_09115 [Paramuribaculum sp.]|nr:hypothetical protein [Paramuribaculum sp.]